ncbi:DUF1295 domain-containing protein [candidate division KSB1 bacterium]|nr:HEAT repeat domain-containing protein [candidate division KSB1 bacterium]RQW04389.1 MAG: DUF1295 domain-containing protein [candidate division KSB1 bacterium]
MNKKLIMKRLEPLFFFLLALVFTIGLMFASAELPKAVDQMLGEKISFLDVATGQNELSDFKTELFLSQYHIRLIGYICLGIVILLIILGFVLEKRGLVSTGAILLFLPVFGHFAATMFFLGGLAFLRFLWLPFLDVSFDIMRLGDIIVLPYKWILQVASLVGINLSKELPFVITGLGIFIFLMGVFAWIYGKIRQQNVTDFWIYRISRHPQYLGWIVWSYGVLFLPGSNMRRYVDVANTLPWLLAAMIIFGIALLEERAMKRKFGDAYALYRARTPFLFPLPRFLRKIFILPFQLLFKKAYPEKKREIATVITFYTAALILASAFYSGMLKFSGSETASQARIDRWVHTIKTSQHRGEIRQAAAALAKGSDAAVDSLITCLDHPNHIVRWYCADALGAVQSDKVVQPLADVLRDQEPHVRRAATGALGNTGSAQAIPILIDAFLDPEIGHESYAARSLGKLGASEAVPLLIKGLKSEEKATTNGCIWALGEIGSKDAVQPLIDYFEQDKDCDYHLVGEALQKLGSECAADVYIAGLQSDTWWVQCACATALGESNSEKGFAPLINALHHGEAKLRRAVVLALSKYPAEQAESTLRQALDDEDWEVRLYAKAALKSAAEKFP